MKNDPGAQGISVGNGPLNNSLWLDHMTSWAILCIKTIFTVITILSSKTIFKRLDYFI